MQNVFLSLFIPDAEVVAETLGHLIRFFNILKHFSNQRNIFNILKDQPGYKAIFKTIVSNIPLVAF